jgi:glycine dehydrogenase subunit 1
MALAATIYLSLLGKNGLRQVAELCYHKAHYAAQKISQIPGFELATQGSYFHEFAIKCPGDVDAINTHLLDHGILGGYDLSKEYPQLKKHMLVAVTEMNSREDIDYLCEALEAFSHD